MSKCTNLLSVLATQTWLIAQAFTWNPIPLPLLPPRADAAVDYDTARNVLVVFGGTGTTGQRNDTWEWDGSTWQIARPITAPTPRDRPVMAYDSARGVMVMFGGHPTDRSTWEWDGDNWRQRETSTAPPARRDHAMAYDSVRRRVVLFGGILSQSIYSDTWEYDGNNWTPRANGPMLFGCAMTYDRARQRTVLFGGDDGRIKQDKTFEWDGSGWSMSTPAIRPLARTTPGMTYDSVRQRVVMAGGWDAATGRLGDTWEWNGSQWTQVGSGYAQAGHRLTFETRVGRVLAVGLFGVFGPDDHFSAWSGTAWVGLPRPIVPAYRQWPCFSFDPIRNRTVMFGGRESGPRLAGETLEFDGRLWLQRNIPSPQPRWRATMIFDAARNYHLLFGGEMDGGILLNDTHTYDGTNWTQQVPTVSPSPRSDSAIWYDSVRQRVILLGGTNYSTIYSDMWEWTGSSWVSVPAGNWPYGGFGYSCTHDPVRNRTVLVGPAGTWEWDGSAWLNRNTSARPSQRRFAALTYNPRTARSVLFGGTSVATGAELADTWQWDGTNWTEMPTSPGAIGMARSTWDTTNGRILVFGSYTDRAVWAYGTTTEASIGWLGPGCSSSNVQPILGGNHPVLGSSRFVIALDRAPPNSASVVVLATAQSRIYMGAGCTFYLGGTTALLPVGTDSTGFARVQLSVPALSHLRGAGFFAQAFTVDPMSVVASLAFSEGRAYRIGD